MVDFRLLIMLETVGVENIIKNLILSQFIFKTIYFFKIKMPFTKAKAYLSFKYLIDLQTICNSV